MRRRPPRSTLTDTLFPYTTLFRSVPAYPSVASLRAMAPGGHEADIFDFRIQPRFADAKAFLGHLRGLGAHVPKGRSEEHTSELQSLMRISYAVFRLRKKIPIAGVARHLTRCAHDTGEVRLRQ